jgi:pimeloyl-ACP methyl ester carboxylesterase
VNQSETEAKTGFTDRGGYDMPESHNLEIGKSIVPRVRRTRERPLHFTSAGRPLYGVFHPAGPTGKDRVLVFCHSLGSEHMATQRIQVLGARLAASAGFASFRYDSRAHGDSAGDLEELTFADLVEDAYVAADCARELSGAARIIWVGVRFGCLVATEAMARRDDAAALALWEPVHQGEDFFRAAVRAMFFSEITEGRRPVGTVDELLKRLGTGGAVPIVGTYIHHPLYCTAYRTGLRHSVRNWAGDTLLAQVQHRPTLSAQNECLRADIQRRGGKVTIALIGQEPAWNRLPLTRPQWTSEPLLTTTKEWLRELE